MKWLLLFLPAALHAQIALFTFNGATESPVGSVYNYGDVSSGDTKDIRFHAKNTGSASVVLTTLAVAGSGFNITAVNGTVPSTIAPGLFLEFTVRFAASLPA